MMMCLKADENTQSATARHALEQLRTKELFNSVLFACFVKKVRLAVAMRPTVAMMF